MREMVIVQRGPTDGGQQISPLCKRADMELQYSRYYLVIWALLARDSGPFVMRFSPYCAGGAAGCRDQLAFLLIFLGNFAWHRDFWALFFRLLKNFP